MLQSLGSFERTDGVELVGVAVCLALDIVMRDALTMVFRSVRAASSARFVCMLRLNPRASVTLGYLIVSKKIRYTYLTHMKSGSIKRS